jgi:porin
MTRYLKSYRACCLAALALVAAAPHALARSGAFEGNDHFMLGDWGGERTRLQAKGINFIADYVGESASNLDGGFDDKSSTRYADQFTLGINLDLHKLLGWQGANFRFAATERDGDSLSADRISDPRAPQLSAVQEIFGRGETWRLTDFWLSQSLMDGELEIKAGRFGVGEDFNVFECDFQNLAFCGSQVGNWTSIWYNWPVSQLAFRVRWVMSPQWYFQLGIIDENPNELKTSNKFRLMNSGSNGVLVPLEAVWQPRVGARGLAGKYSFGYYYASGNAEDVLEDINGDPQPLTGLPFREQGHKYGAWLVAEQRLTAHANDPDRGLRLFANLTFEDKDTSRISDFQQLGLVYTGLFDARPRDEIGLGLARIGVNGDLRRFQRLTNQVNGIADYYDPGFQPEQDEEYNAELNYGIHFTGWITVRPNLQYIWDPGGVAEVDDAFVLGIKVQATF